MARQVRLTKKLTKDEAELMLALGKDDEHFILDYSSSKAGDIRRNFESPSTVEDLRLELKRNCSLYLFEEIEER